MNSLGAGLVWCGVQVSLLAIAGGAVYFLLGRRGPAARSLAAFSVLTISIGLVAMAFSPWPSWWQVRPSQFAASDAHQSTASGDAATAASSTNIAEQADNAQPSHARSTSAPLQVESDAATWARALWSTVWDGLGSRAPSDATTAPRWPAVVAWLLAVGAAMGLLRVVVGLAAVRAYRRRTQSVRDEALNALLESLCLRLGCLRPVELRESGEIGAPATVGWRRPLVLLPPQWREWTESERQAVLAHEVAHIVRGDFAAWLVAQLGVVLHFYNPLVHWLARRLRIEQELAADALGAMAAGGSGPYLKTLAMMALRQDDRAVSWAARPFLPARGTLLRRIEMLRDRKQNQIPLFSKSKRIALCSLLAAIGFLVAGLRGPGGSMATAADEGAAASVLPHHQPIDLNYVPGDAGVVVAVRPASLLNSEAGKLIGKTGVGELKKAEESLGLPLSEIEYAKFVMSDVSPKGPGPSFGRMILRATHAHDWTKFAATIVRDPVAVEATGEGAGKKFFKPGPQKEPPLHSYGVQNPEMSYYVADDRTIVFAVEQDMPQVIAASIKPEPGPKWSQSWYRAATGDVAIMFDVEKFRKVIEPDLKRGAGGPGGAMVAMMAPLWQDSQRLFVGTALSEKLGLFALDECSSEEGAARVEQTTRGLVAFGLNGLAAASKVEPDGPPEMIAIKKTLVGAAEQLLKTTQVKHDGSTVVLESQGDGATLLAVASIALPAIQKTREAASRAQSMNNMKQLALAMHMYAADHKDHFPPAVVMGPDGKTPHSWRIEILPYLEQQNLYHAYKMNEPWDSPDNKKISETRVATFGLGDDEGKNHSDYYVLTGKGTVFSGKEGMKVQDITGGTSNTILIVEAKRDIPWTKPEDIEFDPDKAPPKLGGHFAGGFIAAFADGSVRFINDNTDARVLKALIGPGADAKAGLDPNWQDTRPGKVAPPAATNPVRP